MLLLVVVSALCLGALGAVAAAVASTNRQVARTRAELDTAAGDVARAVARARGAVPPPPS